MSMASFIRRKARAKSKSCRRSRLPSACDGDTRGNCPCALARLLSMQETGRTSPRYPARARKSSPRIRRRVSRRARKRPPAWGTPARSSEGRDLRPAWQYRFEIVCGKHLRPDSCGASTARLAPFRCATVPDGERLPVQVKELKRQFLEILRVARPFGIGQKRELAIGIVYRETALEEAVRVVGCLALSLSAIDEGKGNQPRLAGCSVCGTAGSRRGGLGPAVRSLPQPVSRLLPVRSREARPKRDLLNDQWGAATKPSENTPCRPCPYAAPIGVPRVRRRRPRHGREGARELPQQRSAPSRLAGTRLPASRPCLFQAEFRLRRSRRDRFQCRPDPRRFVLLWRLRIPRDILPFGGLVLAIELGPHWKECPRRNAVWADPGAEEFLLHRSGQPGEWVRGPQAPSAGNRR